MLKKFTFKEKVMDLSEHPQYVQNGFNRYILLLVLIILSTIAAAISLKSLAILSYGAFVSLIMGGITYHLYYVLTRDEALVLEGECVDITTEVTLYSRKVGATRIIIKSNDMDNDRTYSIINKLSYHCNIGDGISLYTTKRAVYVDTNEFIVINRPLFIKITKNR